MARTIRLQDNSAVIALSKKKILVDADAYNERYFAPGQNPSTTGAPGIADNLRGRLDAYWNKGEFRGVSIVKPVFIFYEDPVQVQVPSAPFGQFQQKFTLNANTGFYRSLTDLYWRSFISKDFLTRIPFAREAPTLTTTIGTDAATPTRDNSRTPQLAQPFVVSPTQEVAQVLQVSTFEVSPTQAVTPSLQVNTVTPTQPVTPSLQVNTVTPTQTVNQPPQVLIVQTAPPVIAERGPVEIPVTPTFSDGKVFYDHACDAPGAYSKEEISNLNITIGGLFADVLTNYNFYAEPYELIAEREDVPEALLPSSYAFATEAEEENRDADETATARHITLYKTIPDVFTDVVNNRGKKIGEKDKGQYFDKFGAFFDTFRNEKTQEYNDLQIKFKNIVIGTNNFARSQDYNNNKFLFPMYNEITFKTDVRAEIATILKNTKLSSQLIVDTIEGKVASTTKPFAVITEDRRDAGNQTIDTTIYRKENKDLQIWDFDVWAEQLFNRQDTFSSLPDIIFVGRKEDDDKMTYDVSYRFLKNVSALILKGAIRDYVKNKMRSFEEMMKGKKAHTETLFYRIDKVEKRSGNLVQSFYLANSNDVDTATFVDSQVKFNKEYTYKVFLMNIVVGTEYSYEVLTVSSTSAEVVANYKPSVKMIEVPFYEESIHVLDAPPIRPDISIFPYYSVNNRLKFVLNNGIGREREKEIIIEPQDVGNYQAVRRAQKAQFDGPIEFESDDIPSAFQIYRLDKAPTSYKDFSGNRIALKETDVDRASALKASATAFIDNISPNKKYWYTFRAVDVHGKISNPTDVFEIELVDDQGTVYPIISVYNFDVIEKSFKKITKSIKKYLLIEPEFLQKAINDRKSGIYQADGTTLIPSILGKKDWAVGLRDEAVWDKRWKLRVISKKTGKKLDVNFKFRHTQVGNE